MNTLKVLEPKAFETDMLPSPCFATIRLANRFGSEVPAAVKVSPTETATPTSVNQKRRRCTTGGDGTLTDILRNVKNAAHGLGRVHHKLC